MDNKIILKDKDKANKLSEYFVQVFGEKSKFPTFLLIWKVELFSNMEATYRTANVLARLFLLQIHQEEGGGWGWGV